MKPRPHITGRRRRHSACSHYYRCSGGDLRDSDKVNTLPSLVAEGGGHDGQNIKQLRCYKAERRSRARAPSLADAYSAKTSRKRARVAWSVLGCTAPKRRTKRRLSRVRS